MTTGNDTSTRTGTVTAWDWQSDKPSSSYNYTIKLTHKEHIAPMFPLQNIGVHMGGQTTMNINSYS